MSVLFLELDRIVLFLSSPLVLALATWRGCRNSSCGEGNNQKASSSGDAVVGHELLATTLADKHMATVLPNCVLVRCCKDLKALS